MENFGGTSVGAILGGGSLPSCHLHHHDEMSDARPVILPVSPCFAMRSGNRRRCHRCIWTEWPGARGQCCSFRAPRSGAGADCRPGRAARAPSLRRFASAGNLVRATQSCATRAATDAYTHGEDSERSQRQSLYSERSQRAGAGRADGRRKGI